MNKQAAIGDSVLMMYRIILVTIIALIVLGSSAIFYQYILDVREVEAIVMVEKVKNCIVPEGIIDLSKLRGHENKILDYCGIKNTERFYVSVSGGLGNESFKFIQGDPDKDWINDIKQDSYKKYYLKEHSRLISVTSYESEKNSQLQLLISAEVAYE